MSLLAMGKCERHPQSAVPGDGVCPSCLQKKLTHVWRGESHSDTVFAHEEEQEEAEEAEASTSMTRKHQGLDPILPKETLAIIGSIASIAKRASNQPPIRDTTRLDTRYENAKPCRKPHPSFDVRDGGPAKGDTFTDASGSFPPVRKQSHDIEGVMKEWAVLHGKRRGGQGQQKQKKSVTIVVDESPMVEHSRAGLPLVDRIAKETALRVIQEMGDDVISDEEFHQEELASMNRQSEGNIWEDHSTLPKSMKQQQQQHQEKSTFGLGAIRSKWVKGLGSSLGNSSKVFPSKSVENVQKPQSNSRLKNSRVLKKSPDQRRGLSFNVGPNVIPPPKAAYDSGFTSEAVIEGMPDEILKPEDMNQRLRTSYNTVLSWLQDLPSPKTALFQQMAELEEDPPSPSPQLMEPRNNDMYGEGEGEGLTTVGHLHEIAEEHENFDESSEEELSTANHLSEVSSFGKFLARAAQRQPREGLSRVVSVPSRR